MEKQLSFENLRLNPSVPKEAGIRLKKQAKVIYNRLITGPVWTSELITIARQYNARLNEIRKVLREFGLTVDIIGSKPNGDNRYAIRPLYGSKYQAKLMKRMKGSRKCQ